MMCKLEGKMLQGGYCNVRMYKRWHYDVQIKRGMENGGHYDVQIKRWI